MLQVVFYLLWECSPGQASQSSSLLKIVWLDNEVLCQDPEVSTMVVTKPTKPFLGPWHPYVRRFSQRLAIRITEKLQCCQVLTNVYWHGSIKSRGIL